jgi:hypothetical protein
MPAEVSGVAKCGFYRKAGPCRSIESKGDASTTSMENASSAERVGQACRSKRKQKGCGGKK